MDGTGVVHARHGGGPLHLRHVAPDMGIMLLFMWYMTQIVPDRVMTTSTTVKIIASMVQPPSDLEFMWRK